MSESADIFFWLLTKFVDEKTTQGRVLFKFMFGSLICVASIFVPFVLDPGSEDSGNQDGSDDDGAIPVSTTIELFVGAAAVSNVLGFLGMGALSYFANLETMGGMIPKSELREDIHDIFKSASVFKTVSSFSFFYLNVLFSELYTTVLILVVVIFKGGQLQARNDIVGYITFALLALDNLTSWIKIFLHGKTYISFLKSFFLSFSLRSCLGDERSSSTVCCASTVAFPFTWFAKGIKFMLIWVIGFILTATVGVFYLICVFLPLLVLWPIQILMKLFRRYCCGGGTGGIRTGLRILDATLLEEDEDSDTEMSQNDASSGKAVAGFDGLGGMY